MKFVLPILLLLITLFNVCGETEPSCCQKYAELEKKYEKFVKKTRQEIQELKDIVKLLIECPQGFDAVRHSCYKIVTKKRNKFDAATYCEFYDAHLVKITTVREMGRLIKYIEEEKTGEIKFYTALHLNTTVTPVSEATQGANWVWSKKKAIKYTKYNQLGYLPLTDSDDQISNCAVLKKVLGGWYLKDEYCDVKAAFICEKRRKRKRF